MICKRKRIMSLLAVVVMLLTSNLSIAPTVFATNETDIASTVANGKITADMFPYQDDSGVIGFRSAQWIRISHHLSFDVNGGNASSKLSNQVLEVGEFAVKPSDPTKDGYTFIGWNTAQDGTGVTWNFATTPMPGSNVTLYAQWQEDNTSPPTRYFMLHANGGEWYSPDVSMDENGFVVVTHPGDLLDVQNLSPHLISREGYTLLGLDEDRDAVTPTYSDFMNIETPKSVYAIWKKEAYTLSFDVNGGDVSSKPVDQVLEVGEFAVKPSDPTKGGDTFIGWNTAQDGSGVIWDFEKMPMPSSDVTLYAQWQEITVPPETYTLSFDVNGGNASSQPSSQVLGVGEFATKPTNPTRQGYTFMGWNIEQDGSGAEWNFKETPMPGSDVILYAQWKKDRTTGGGNEGNGGGNLGNNNGNNSGNGDSTSTPNPDIDRDKPTSPQTGDHHALGLYIALLIASFGIVMVSSRSNRRFSENEK